MSAASSTLDSLVSPRSVRPENSGIFPPSPPISEDKLSSSVARVIRLLQDHRDGRLDNPWIVIRLEPGDYGEVGRQLRRDRGLLEYTQRKIRFDYDPQTLEFIIRMPSTIHEAFLGSITKDIDTQLSAISESNHSAAALARQIDHLCSSTIRLEDGSTHNPDSQYKHRAAQYPGVAIEVAYSQSKKEGGKILSKLADQYIVESSGGIKLVICINLEYRGTKKATISTWSPKYIKDQGEEYLVASETMGSQEFRKEDGSSVAQNVLRLQLKHFVPSQLEVPSEALEKEVVIRYENLAMYLDTAEAHHQLTEAKTGILEVLRPGARKRRREVTPPEELESKDERQYEREELAELRRANEHDEDWKL